MAADEAGLIVCPQTMRYPNPVIVQRMTLFEYVFDLYHLLGEILPQNGDGHCAKHRKIIRPDNSVKTMFVRNIQTIRQKMAYKELNLWKCDYEFSYWDEIASFGFKFLICGVGHLV